MSIYTYETKKDTRSGFGAGMEFLSLTNPKVVALCADLIGSLKMNDFKENSMQKNINVQFKNIPLRVKLSGH